LGGETVILVEEALARLLALIDTLPPEQIALPEGLGRVLAEDIAARRTQPPFAVSAMDGYAVRADDLGRIPAELRIVAEVPAGAGFGGHVGAGEAARIFTGAPMPAGTDTVVVQENTERDGDRVRVLETARCGHYVRRQGLDFAEGEVLLRAGRRLTARDIGLAAAMNRPWLFVHRRPRIGILSTGDEIVLPGEPIGPHQIVSSNSLALSAIVSACGGIAVSVGNAPDDPAALRRIAAATRGVDLLVTTGGASVGEHDLVRDALAADGFELDFWQIAMRPGKPLMVGRYRGTPMLGLPGNPVSSFVCSMLFLAPAIERLSGAAASGGPMEATARLGAPVAANDRRQDYLRARLARAADGVEEAFPFEVQDSSMMRLLAIADCLILRPPHAPAVPAGLNVPIIRFPTGALPI
jgi:molybdopterin molybdotransferase